MNQLSSQIESILSYATKPMKYKVLQKATGANRKSLEEAIQALQDRYNQDFSGIRLMDHNESLQLVTAPENAELIQKVFAADMTGELTKPALETLTIVAYRGPISKPELELIRGVNCSLIIRNLMMRGLILEQKEKDEMLPSYAAAPEFLQFLGMTSVKELPDFEELSGHELLNELLKHRSQEVNNEL